MNATSLENLRKLIRWGWVYFLYLSGLTYWARMRLAASGEVIVLTLHRVLEDAEASTTRSPSGMIVKKQTFHELLKYIGKGCEIVRLEDAFGPRQAGGKPRLAITFDDGWKDTGAIAFPLAEQYRMPIAVFVCPALVDKVSPFWPERIIGVLRAASADVRRKSQFADLCRAAGLDDPSSSHRGAQIEEEKLLSQIKNLSARKLQKLVCSAEQLAIHWGNLEAPDQFEGTLCWEELIRLHEQGVSIGSHSQNHAILTQLEESEVAAELVESKAEIERVLGRPCTLFAYPNGSWSEHVRRSVIEFGYARAFINAPGLWKRDRDQYLIPRVNLWEGSLIGPFGRFSPAVFLYSTFWRLYRQAGA
ncbi:MAG: polysaccharide deacetylase [Candidatus Acidoferrum typicum]|nr:polysaccharide deacetylase [Candidatus Acidoferrum typicum]